MDASSDKGSNQFHNLKVAWLMPSAHAGAHWQPIWSDFLKAYKNTIFFTTRVWKEFDPQEPYGKATCRIGELKSVLIKQKGAGYHHGYLKLPLHIIFPLAKYRPDVIVANAFSLWTIVAVTFKYLFGWKIIVLYEGSTPSSDFKDSRLRTLVRRYVAALADAFIANNKSAQQYLNEFLEIEPSKIVTGPYLLPEIKAMTSGEGPALLDISKMSRPIFLFVGQIIKRKGIYELLEACCHLSQYTDQDYTLLIIGEGEEENALRDEIHRKSISKQVILAGRVDYEQLGPYFKESDVFVFPTFEDTWGMSCLEAMAYGMPVLCSRHAGCSELVEDGFNGYIIDPYEPTHMVERMHALTDTNRAREMGKCSAKIIASYISAGFLPIFEAAIKIAFKDS